MPVTYRYRLLFLGTSAALPTPERNQSCISLQTPYGTLIFDVGEGAQTSIQKYKVKLKKNFTILLTHFHPDHCQGILGLLSSLDLLGRKEQVTIIGPVGTIQFIKEYFRLFSLGVRYNIKVFEIEKSGRIDFGQYWIEWFPTEHFYPSYGFIFREKPQRGKFNEKKARELGIPEGRERTKLIRGETILVNGRLITPSEVVGPETPGISIAYTGDTKPSEIVANAVKNVDILIHEGTFPSIDDNRYLKYRHSRIIDAAYIAKQADVKRLFITHISSRVTDLDNELRKAKSVFENSELAFDGLEYIIS